MAIFHSDDNADNDDNYNNYDNDDHETFEVTATSRRSCDSRLSGRSDRCLAGNHGSRQERTLLKLPRPIDVNSFSAVMRGNRNSLVGRPLR